MEMRSALIVKNTTSEHKGLKDLKHRAGQLVATRLRGDHGQVFVVVNGQVFVVVR